MLGGLSLGWTEIRVICDDPSHAPKVVIVDRLLVAPEWSSLPSRGGGVAGPIEMLDGDERLDDSRLLGTEAAPLDQDYNAAHPRDRLRRRMRFRCKLCGLDVPLRGETVARLAEGLEHAGRDEVRLADLAANL